MGRTVPRGPGTQPLRIFVEVRTQIATTRAGDEVAVDILLAYSADMFDAPPLTRSECRYLNYNAQLTSLPNRHCERAQRAALA